MGVIPMKELLGITKVGYHDLNAFNRFKHYENLDTENSSIGYIFFTKPDMNLNQNFPNDFFNEPVGKNLINSNFNGTGFMYPLTSLSLSIDLADTSIKTENYFQTVKGYKMVMGQTNVESVSEGTFSISYLDTQSLQIMNLHKFWLDYINDVKIAKIDPNPKAIRTQTNIGFIDYACSVYFFKLRPDGSTISFYSKYTGVFPNNVPYSSLNWQLGDKKVLNYSIPYSYSFKSELEPWILADFNKSAKMGGVLATLKEVNSATLNQNWCRKVAVGKQGNYYKLYFTS